MSVTPDSLAFSWSNGASGSPTASRDVTVTNTGGSAAAGLAATLQSSGGMSGADFSVAAGSCGGSLAAHESCTFTVTANAAADGSYADTLTIAADGVAGWTVGLSADASGFGGCVIALAPVGLVDEIRSAVAMDYRSPDGREAEVHVCAASGGAGVLA